MRRPVFFCSSTWMLQPASRAQVNIDVNMTRDLGEVEDDGSPELHVGFQHSVGTTFTQFYERGLLMGPGNFVGCIELACRPTKNAGSRGSRHDRRGTKPMRRSPLSSTFFT